MKRQRYSHSPLVLSEGSGNQVILLSGDGTELLTLNEVGSLLWQTLERPRTEEEIVESLRGQFPDITLDRLERDVRTFLHELEGSELIVSDAEG